jgi:hypothetical protein
MDRANLPAHGLAEKPKSPRFSPNAARVIDVLTYPAVQLLDVTGPIQVFASANDLVARAAHAGWTTDRDFAGTGVASWSTPNLMRGPAGAASDRA